MAKSMWANEFCATMRKPYTSPSAFAVEFSLHEVFLAASGNAVGITDGSSVADREPTNDAEGNQFVKETDIWDEQW